MLEIILSTSGRSNNQTCPCRYWGPLESSLDRAYMPYIILFVWFCHGSYLNHVRFQKAGRRLRVLRSWCWETSYWGESHHAGNQERGATMSDMSEGVLLWSISLNMSSLMAKPTKWHVRPAKTQISLGIRPVWSASSMCAQWVAKDSSFLHADSEDSDQTERMPRLIWVSLGARAILLVLSWGGSIIQSTETVIVGDSWFLATHICI